MENRTEPTTIAGWVRYVVVAAVAIFLVAAMLRFTGVL